MSLSACSTEVFLIILGYLDAKDRVKLANTSRRYRRLIESLTDYWKKLYDEWDLTIRSFVQLNLFIHMKLKNDPLGYSLMRHYVLLKKAQYHWKKAEGTKLVYEIPKESTDESDTTPSHTPVILKSNLWGTIVRCGPKFYILHHLTASVGLQQLSIEGLLTDIKENNCKFAVEINEHYVVLLINWEKGSLYWQQLYIWSHNDYSHSIELYVPVRISQIKMLSGHWLALGTMPDAKFRKSELHIYNLTLPDQPPIPFPFRHHFYYDHFDTNNDEEFRFYGVSLNTIHHNRMMSEYCVHPDGTISIINTRHEKTNPTLKITDTWWRQGLSNDNFCVYNPLTTGTFNLCIYLEDSTLDLFPRAAYYYACSLKGKLIYLKDHELGITDMRNLNEAKHKKYFPRKHFIMVIMGQFCVFSILAGLYTIHDLHSEGFSGKQVNQLSYIFRYNTQKHLSEMGFAFIYNKSELHILNMCDLF